MSAREGGRPAVAPPEEDPNATIACASPPCFLHELDPAFLGHLGCGEVAALLDALLAADWGGPEEARLRAGLRRHREALGVGAVGACRPAGGLILALRGALPRIGDAALRRDLAAVLRVLEGGLG